MHEPPPAPENALLPAAPLECAPLIFCPRIVIWERAACDRCGARSWRWRAGLADGRPQAEAPALRLAFRARRGRAFFVVCRMGGAATRVWRTATVVAARTRGISCAPSFCRPRPRHGGTRRVGPRALPARGVASHKAKRAISASTASCPSFVDKQLTRRRGSTALVAEAALKPQDAAAAQPLHRPSVSTRKKSCLASRPSSAPSSRARSSAS